MFKYESVCMNKTYDSEKKNNRPQTCRNCGINGHLYKDCIHPIMSFGVICYKIVENEILFLMIQRKDSLSFMEFIRGKYGTNDVLYLKTLVQSMTKNEKNLLLKKNFDEIWNYAWYQNNASTIKHTSEYIESKNKFENLKSNNILDRLIYNSFYTSEHEQEWGFPKGRRKLKESDIDCAIREFCEETRLNSDDIEVFNDIKPFEEIFFGTNNVLYKHTYYVSKMKNNDLDVFVDKNCLEQVREVRALKWFNYTETMQHIKQYNVERHQIVQQVYEILKGEEKIF
jgi:8-oxo-dGTP pyrophosphatase MutT (NUDIX family)